MLFEKPLIFYGKIQIDARVSTLMCRLCFIRLFISVMSDFKTEERLSVLDLAPKS